MLVNKTVLYPFRIDKDFHIGYAWSAELSRLLKLKFSLFTTLSPLSNEAVADVYHALADAQGYYVKNFELLHLRLKPIKSERNFLEGEFLKTFYAFVNQTQPHITVLQSDLFPNEVMKDIIDSGRKVIVLSSNKILNSPVTRKDRAHLFITMLQNAALYNIPYSFFKIMSEDISLFNSIAHFFRMQ
jgi:hypothetical protein